jgi:hypothetical protein
MGFKSSKLYLSVKSLVLFLPLLGTTLVLFQNCSRSQFALQGADQLGSANSLSSVMPSIVLNQDIPALTNQSSITTSFSVVDDTNNQVKSIVCELDGPNSSQVVKDCSAKTVTFSSLVDGDYTLSMMLNSTAVSTSSLQPQSSGSLYTVRKVFRKDNTPPVITVSSTPPSSTSSLTAQFIFTVTDNLSGVQSVVCSLDNAAFSSCVSGTTLNVAIGSHNYQIKATDVAGNVSQAYSYSWTVTTAPVASITLASNITSPTKSGSATFTFSSSASGSTYQCSVDNAAYASCSSPDTLSAAEGSHSFSVKGIDSSGASSSVSTFNWVVDQTAPSTPSILSNLTSPSKSNAVSYSFSSTDAVGVAGYQCSQDGTTFSACTSPKAYTLTDGTKSFYVKASDAAGNVSGVARLDLVIDTVAPVIAITSTQSTTNLSGNITFTITENGSGINKIQCSLDSSAFASCTSPYAYTVAAGSHNFQVQANDLAGNVSATVASSWTIAAPAPSPSPSPTPAPSGTLSIKISGNQFVDGNGNPIQLRGANFSAFEGVAISGWDPADPSGAQAGQVGGPNWTAFKSWKLNVVRVPLNEASWLGYTCYDNADTTKPRNPDPGANYKSALTTLVQQAGAAGLYVILDLHWAAPGKTCPALQDQMADSDNSIAFWQSIATTFKSYPYVMFELFNEPFLNFDFVGDPWSYLMFGTNGSFSGYPTSANGNWIEVKNPWNIASYQAMLTAVRNTGATNPVLIGALSYTSDLSGWLSHKPTDPLGQIAAAWHPYPAYGATWGDASYQWTNNCTSYQDVQNIMKAGIPVIATETGDHNTAGTVGAPFVSNITKFVDNPNVVPQLSSTQDNGYSSCVSSGWVQTGTGVPPISLIGWTWDIWGNPDNVLIKDVNGTPTDGYGQVFQAWTVNHK